MKDCERQTAWLQLAQDLRYGLDFGFGDTVGHGWLLVLGEGGVYDGAEFFETGLLATVEQLAVFDVHAV